jgi:phenylalanyl-tRNA synthetase beta chain
MQVSYNWLKELIDFNYDVKGLTDRLTLIGTACEGIEPLAADLDNVVVAKVIECETHPEAEKMSICVVDIGKGDIRTVICGAPNVRAGMKSALALPGAVLQGKYEIKVIEKYGIKSEGMLCSEAELGLSDEADRIMDLESSFRIGSPLGEALKLHDYILSFELTPNRPDCLCAIGIARDIAAITGSPLKRPEIKFREADTPATEKVTIGIADPDACPRYAARVIDKVKVGSSPWWIKQRLMASGMRSINNIVDITNYVMLEYGQPLHAFDYDNFGKPEVLVRRANKGEKFTTLDGIERELNEEVLLITDGEKPVAIGGIMGGEYSEVTEKTKTVLLESAHFNGRVIRRGRKFLNLTSESQDRFERGADPNIVPEALDRAAALIAKLAGGKVLSGRVDSYPTPIEPLELELRPARVNQILATDLSSPQMIDILNRLEFKVTPGKSLTVTVPTFRPDVTREIDLVEEIARVYGYANIPTRMASGGDLVTKKVSSEEFTQQLREVIMGQGYFEAVANSIVDPKLVSLLSPGTECIEILNPVSEDLKWMRPDLLTGLLAIVKHNLNHRVGSIKLFEIGNTFLPSNEELPREKAKIGLALSGRDAGENWTFHPGEFSFYDLSGTIECIAGLTDKHISYTPASSTVFTTGESFEIKLENETIGVCGKVDDMVLKAVGIKQDVYLAELDFESILSSRRGTIYYQPLPKYPSADRDIAVVVEERVIISDLMSSIRQAGGDFLKKVNLFDVYRGKQVGSGHKSVAFRLVFLDESKTLTDEYIDNVCKEIVYKLEKEHGAKLRAI